MRPTDIVSLSVYVTENDKEKIENAARSEKVSESEWVKRAVAFYMEARMGIEPIASRSRKGGKRPGAGRKPSSRAS